MTVYSSCKIYILAVNWRTVTVYTRCKLEVKGLCILAVNLRYSECVF